MTRRRGRPSLSERIRWLQTDAHMEGNGWLVNYCARALDGCPEARRLCRDELAHRRQLEREAQLNLRPSPQLDLFPSGDNDPLVRYSVRTRKLDA